MQIAVIGAAECSVEEGGAAEEIGYLIADNGGVLCCGGRGGVMEAACRGAREAGGMTVGILPGTGGGNPHLSVVIRSDLGNARNAVLVSSADAVIAVGGGVWHALRDCTGAQDEQTGIWIENLGY